VAVVERMMTENDVNRGKRKHDITFVMGEDLSKTRIGVDGWIILGWISKRWDVGMWTGLGWPRIETGGGRL